MQLLILILSYLYGILFYLLTRYNMFITKKLSTIKKFIITLIFIIDITILYIYLLYHLNNGKTHPYYLFMVILGFITIGINYKKVVKLCKKISKRTK